MRIKVFAVLVLACCFATACPAPCDLEDAEAARVHADAAAIVAALEEFRQSENKYPQTLAELAPKYLARVPEKIGARKFSYWTNENGKYNLRVEARDGGSYSGSCSLADIEARWRKIAPE